MHSNWVVPDDGHGLRLDQILTRMIPGMGRRGARKIWEHALVLVDGRRQRPGYRVHAGQRVTWERLESAAPDPRPESAQAADSPVVEQNDSYAALIKLAGLHCVAIANRGGTSIEASLPKLFPKLHAVLLNRLDQPVSGLVLAALNQDAADNYAAWQNQGAVRKHYLAVVSGQVTETMEIRFDLDTAKRRKVRVMSQEEPDALRWTRVFPAKYREASDESLVRVEIHKGRRHQIRAHLAAAGHPVKYDPLYGTGPDQGWIYLHHCSIALPDFTATNLPAWPEWDAVINSPGPWQNLPR